MTGGYGIAVPKGLSQEVADKLREALYETFQYPEEVKMLSLLGFTPAFRDAEQFKKFVSEEEAKYRKVAKEANIKID